MIETKQQIPLSKIEIKGLFFHMIKSIFKENLEQTSYLMKYWKISS